jgi:hypothetical protein
MGLEGEKGEKMRNKEERNWPHNVDQRPLGTWNMELGTNCNP